MYFVARKGRCVWSIVWSWHFTNGWNLLWISSNSCGIYSVSKNFTDLALYSLFALLGRLLLSYSIINFLQPLVVFFLSRYKNQHIIYQAQCALTSMHVKISLNYLIYRKSSRELEICKGSLWKRPNGATQELKNLPIKSPMLASSSVITVLKYHQPYRVWAKTTNLLKIACLQFIVLLWARSDSKLLKPFQPMRSLLRFWKLNAERGEIHLWTSWPPAEVPWLY